MSLPNSSFCPRNGSFQAPSDSVDESSDIRYSVVFVLLDERHTHALNDSLEASSTAIDTFEDMTRQVNARCTDLIEIVVSKRSVVWKPIPHLAHSVTFLHRTVRDFLRTAELHNKLTAGLSEPFDEHIALSHAYLLAIRQLQPDPDKSTRDAARILVDRLLSHARENECRTSQSDHRLLDRLSQEYKRMPNVLRSNRTFFEAITAWQLK